MIVALAELACLARNFSAGIPSSFRVCIPEHVACLLSSRLFRAVLNDHTEGLDSGSRGNGYRDESEWDICILQIILLNFQYSRGGESQENGEHCCTWRRLSALCRRRFEEFRDSLDEGFPRLTLLLHPECQDTYFCC